MCLYAHSQDKRVWGKVIVSTSQDVLKGVKIYTSDSTVVAYSKAFGKFSIVLPGQTDSIIFSFSKFQSYIYEFPEVGESGPILVCLEPVNCGSFPKLKKNTIAFAPTELVNKKISLMYERFVTRKHSVGIFNDAYINSHTVLYKTPVYNGYKMELFYRYYPFRNNGFGTYVQGKVMWGYFDVEDIPYYRTDYHSYNTEIGVSNQFYTGGFGFCGGITWYPANKLYISISAGLQYFPMNVPKTIEFENQTYNLGISSGSLLVFVTNPWYVTGPGCINEIKILFGGIF